MLSNIFLVLHDSEKLYHIWQKVYDGVYLRFVIFKIKCDSSRLSSENETISRNPIYNLYITACLFSVRTHATNIVLCSSSSGNDVL